MKYEPCGKRAIVKVVKPEETTASGLVIPASVERDENIVTGEVVRVDDYREDCEVSEGDIVVIGKYAGVKLDADHLLVAYDEILARMAK